jgi:hypothetical protein
MRTARQSASELFGRYPIRRATLTEVKRLRCDARADRSGRRQPSAGNYNLPAMFVNRVFNAVATPLTLVAIATAIKPAIKPYSIAVTPLLSLRNLVVNFFILPSELLYFDCIHAARDDGVVSTVIDDSLVHRPGSFALPHHVHRSRLQSRKLRLAVCSISHPPRQSFKLSAFIAYQSYLSNCPLLRGR